MRVRASNLFRTTMKITLKTKIIGGFLLVASLGLVIGLVGIVGLRKSQHTLIEVRGEVFDRGQFLVQATDLARSAQVNFKIQVQEWKNTLLRGSDPEQFAKYWERFGEQEDLVVENLSQLKELLDQNGVPSAVVVSTQQSIRKLGKSYRTAIESYDSSDPLAHQVVDGLVKGIDREPTKAIDGIVDMVAAFEAADASEKEAEFLASMGSLIWIASVTMLVGVLVASGLGLYLGQSVTRQITRIALDLREGAGVVDSAAREVSSYGQSLADTTNREASSIQEASASLEVLAENTRQNAKSAKSAKGIANETRATVNDGKAQMNEMEAAMNAIRESSDGISNILKSIDEIAFQTNILALNAAVEAARAGEAGAGFAVVADEVRNLAQRSAKAARDTSTRIEDSIERSRTGVEISARVSQRLDVILSKASELDDLVAAIADSVSHSSDGVEQVNAAIRQIENAYQSNAAITEESAAAAQELSQQAHVLSSSIQELSEMVGHRESMDSSQKNAFSSSATHRASVVPAAKSNRISEDAKTEDLTLWN